MSSAQYPKTKTWAPDEDLTSADLNAFHDNERSNLNPQGVGGYEDTVPQMQLQTSPGGVGSESLARSLSDELERIRFKLAEVIGKTYWYDAIDVSLSEANALINQIAGLPPNRVVSGNTQGVSDMMPAYLVPNGASNSITIKGTASPLVFRIKGTQYSLTSDVVLSGLVQAPNTNNTALANDARLIGDVFSEVKGEPSSSSLLIDTTGTEITNLVGKYAGFKIVDGGNTEYFTAFVKSSTELTNARRGFLFNSALSPVARIPINDNDVITLMKLTFLFIKTDLSVEAVYTNPTYSAAQPSSPAVGDYWFNVTTNIWNRFSGSAWVDANATLIGICLTDTANTVVARPEDFFFTKSDLCEIRLSEVTNTEVKSEQQGGSVAVLGNSFSFGADDVSWDITTDLESGYSEAPSTMYFLYVTEFGAKKISPQFPQIRQDLAGTAYHPYKQWRAVGMAYNNAGSNLTVASSLKIYPDSEERFLAYGGNGGGATSSFIPRYTTVQYNSLAAVLPLDDSDNGLNYICFWPSVVIGTIQCPSGTSLQYGFSLNTTGTSTSLSSILAAEIVTYTEFTNALIHYTGPAVPLKIGDILRPHFGIEGPSSANFGNSPGQRVSLTRLR